MTVHWQTARAGRPEAAVPGAQRLAFAAMGGEGEIVIAGLAAEAAAPLLAEARAEVQRIEAKFTRYRPDSIVARINAAAGTGRAVPVDAETASLLDFAASLHAQSDGRFDITSGVLRYAWDFRSGRLPSAAEVAALQARVGWSRVHWSAALRSIELPEPGMELDFGGFGKEYAADRAAGVLLAAGVTSGYVNLAGDLRVLGPRPDGAGWRFAIQHPREPDSLIASVELASGGLATSGDYERYLEAEGRRYCHILDARTGWPTHDWQSVSVTAPLCIVAGALSTIAMLAGEAAPRLLAAQASGALLVDGGGALHRV